MKDVIIKICLAVVGLSIVTYIGLLYYVDDGRGEISGHGHIAMVLGIFFSYSIAAALMALLSFSNRYGHDAQVHSSTEQEDDKDKPS
jgi:hypothetical protein